MDDVKLFERDTRNPYVMFKKTSDATLLQGANKHSPGPTLVQMDENEANHHQQSGTNEFNTVIPLISASRSLPDIPSDRQAISALVKIEPSPCDTPTSRPTSSPGKRRSVVRTPTSASKRRKLNNVPHPHQYKSDGGWSIVNYPPRPTPSALESATNPRQWLESREDLSSMVLSRSSMCNGISMDVSTIVVVVDQESGISISLESNILEWTLSMKRDFHPYQPQSPESAIHSLPNSPSQHAKEESPVDIVSFQTSALRSLDTLLREHGHDDTGTLPNAQKKDYPATTSHTVSVFLSERYLSDNTLSPNHVNGKGYYKADESRPTRILGSSHPVPQLQVGPPRDMTSQRLIPPYKSNLAHHYSARPSSSVSLGRNGDTLQVNPSTEPLLEPQSQEHARNHQLHTNNNSRRLENSCPTNVICSQLDKETLVTPHFPPSSDNSQTIRKLSSTSQHPFSPSTGVSVPTRSHYWVNSPHSMPSGSLNNAPSDLNALVSLPPHDKTLNASATVTPSFALPSAPGIYTTRSFVATEIPYALAPTEVRQLLDAEELKIPIVLIASHDSLQSVGLKLDPEFAYSVVGCFQVSQARSQCHLSTNAIPPAYMEAEWKFAIRWIPGGETSFCSYDTHLYSPWWSPTNNSTDPSDDSPDVLPSDLVGDRRSEATGWHCSSCGKVNRQMLFRHLRCSSSFCKNEQAKPLQPISLAQIIKNPQDKLGMAKPSCTKFNAHVQGHCVTWDDGMQTFKYQIKDTSTFCTHVFTGNASELQDEASTLFRDIQTEVQLTFDGIYFTHDQTDTVSEKAPQSLKDAQDWLIHTVKTYSDIADVEKSLRLRTLSVLAWWKDGKRRTASQLQAKSQPVVLACFGNSLTITLARQSSIKTPTRKPRFSGVPSGPSSASATSEKQESMDVFGPTISTQQNVNAIPAEDFVVSMVHGDVLCVFGDDFEYNLKRNGPGMVLIGTS